MGVNPELNALQKEVTRQRILEAAFRLFVDNNIDKVTMQDVARAAGVGVATVYRYYSTKPELAMGVSAWIWAKYESELARLVEIRQDATAAEEFDYYLESYLDLYRNHRDMLRFNQFFNVYIEQESVPKEEMQPFTDVVARIGERFFRIYQHAQKDHTLRTDIPGREIFLTTLHIMMAAITRYAVGLAYGGGEDQEKELVTLKNMLLKEYTINKR